jgi:hypothetical protein
MALIGAAFGLGFTFGPLLGAAALLFSADVGASPWPGYAAALLSGIALLLAIALLPESLRPGSLPAGHRVIDWRAWHDAFETPSVPALLATAFASVVSFAAFETTLSLLLNSDAFRFSFSQVLLYYAFIGLTLTLAQGFLVRRLAPKVGEVAMTLAGGLTTMLGFALLIAASQYGRLPLLMFASAIEVTGFALMTPSLQSLISRRSDPARQGGILGVSQSTSSLARVVGPLIVSTLSNHNFLLPAGPPIPPTGSIRASRTRDAWARRASLRARSRRGRRLPRVLPWPRRDDHRRTRVHRQQSRARARRSWRQRPARRFPDS